MEFKCATSFLCLYYTMLRPFIHSVYLHFSNTHMPLFLVSLSKPLHNHKRTVTEATQSDSGLKAFYCSSRLLYVQKRWPAKTFLVGDTEPQISWYKFLLQFRVLLPRSTCYFHFKNDLENVVQSRVKTDSSLIYRHNFHVVYLITDAKWPPQMGTATLDTRATSPKPISASPTGKEADELDHNVY